MHTYSIQSHYSTRFPCHQISSPALETQTARNALSQLPLHLGWTSDSILASELRGSLPWRIILKQKHRRTGPIASSCLQTLSGRVQWLALLQPFYKQRERGKTITKELPIYRSQTHPWLPWGSWINEKSRSLLFQPL